MKSKLLNIVYLLFIILFIISCKGSDFHVKRIITKEIKNEISEWSNKSPDAFIKNKDIYIDSVVYKSMLDIDTVKRKKLYELIDGCNNIISESYDIIVDTNIKDKGDAKYKMTTAENEIKLLFRELECLQNTLCEVVYVRYYFIEQSENKRRIKIERTFILDENDSVLFKSPVNYFN